MDVSAQSGLVVGSPFPPGGSRIHTLLLSGVLAKTNSNSGRASTKSCIPCCDANPDAVSPPPCRAKILFEVTTGSPWSSGHPAASTVSPSGVFGH